MQRVVTFGLIAVSGIALSACGMNSKTAEIEISKEMIEIVQAERAESIPDWYINTPEDREDLIFGSGTGLSDADREYAKLIAAADITTQQEALLALLKIRRRAMVETVQNFNKVRAATARRVGEQNMTSFPSITMPEEPMAPELLLEPGFVMDQ